MTYPWPLPEGHAYGMGLRPTRHDGAVVLEGIALAALQRRLREHWGQHVYVSGRYDGQTQKALCEVQQTAGMDPTGVLDRDLWNIIWK